MNPMPTLVESSLPALHEKKPLVRRTFSIDGINGGHIDIAETPDFQHITLSVHSPNDCSISIQLDDEQFGELSYLKYVLKTSHSAPF
jgi:hypothetical protein